jgi:hypothetical protein
LDVDFEDLRDASTRLLFRFWGFNGGVTGRNSAFMYGCTIESDDVAVEYVDDDDDVGRDEDDALREVGN